MHLTTTTMRLGRAGAVAGLALAAFGAGAVPAMAADLRAGAVFAASNDRAGNEIVAFSRGADGRLTPAGRFATGGRGSGSFEDTANGLVLGSHQGEASPNNLRGTGKLLFATNPGSDDITVFRVRADGLERVERQASGGEKPVSITVNRGIAYVLHSGETEDRLVPPNCASGALPSITGFRVAPDGELTPIPGSTRRLSGDEHSGCAQVSFDPSGRVLVVTERTARNGLQAPGDEGLITTFTLAEDGTPATQRTTDGTGEGPFGFTFTKQGTLLTTEQFDGPAGIGLGAVSAYAVGPDGTVTPTSGSVGNGGTDSCWVVATDDGKTAFAVSFFEGGRISSYAVGPDGSLALRDATADGGATQTGASDVGLSRDSRYLYNLNSFNGTIDAYRVDGDGLQRIQQVQAHAPSPDEAAPIGLAST